MDAMACSVCLLSIRTNHFHDTCVPPEFYQEHEGVFGPMYLFLEDYFRCFDVREPHGEGHTHDTEYQGSAMFVV